MSVSKSFFGYPRWLWLGSGCIWVGGGIFHLLFPVSSFWFDGVLGCAIALQTVILGWWLRQDA